MEKSTDTYVLNNGLSMPKVGLGTYAIDKIADVIYESVKSGLRLIDTAWYYKNENKIGEGLKKVLSEGLVKREELFVVTKVWPTRKHEIEASVKDSLTDLGLEYVDLVLDHFPHSQILIKGKMVSIPNHESWKNFENLVKKGLTKSIGVSNYNVQLLMNLLTYAEIKPVVNQVEYHPFLVQEGLYKFCKQNGIYIMAFNSLCKGVYCKKQVNLLEESQLTKIAEKHKKSVGQVALSWAVSQGMIVIPASSKPERVRENLESASLVLDEEEITEISKLNKNIRLCDSTVLNFASGVDIFA